MPLRTKKVPLNGQQNGATIGTETGIAECAPKSDPNAVAQSGAAHRLENRGRVAGPKLGPPGGPQFGTTKQTGHHKPSLVEVVFWHLKAVLYLRTRFGSCCLGGASFVEVSPFSLSRSLRIFGVSVARGGFALLGSCSLAFCYHFVMVPCPCPCGRWLGPEFGGSFQGRGASQGASWQCMCMSLARACAWRGSCVQFVSVFPSRRYYWAESLCSGFVFGAGGWFRVVVLGAWRVSRCLPSGSACACCLLVVCARHGFCTVWYLTSCDGSRAGRGCVFFVPPPPSCCPVLCCWRIGSPFGWPLVRPRVTSASCLPPRPGGGECSPPGTLLEARCRRLSLGDQGGPRWGGGWSVQLGGRLFAQG
jgi:hypothetical protein